MVLLIPLPLLTIVLRLDWADAVEVEAIRPAAAARPRSKRRMLSNSFVAGGRVGPGLPHSPVAPSPRRRANGPDQKGCAAFPNPPGPVLVSATRRGPGSRAPTIAGSTEPAHPNAPLG